MPWTRIGDSAATYPKLMQTMGVAGADDRTLNEVAGWLFRCAFQSAAHTTDYRIDVGTAWMLGGARTEELIRIALAAGLAVEIVHEGVRYLRMIDDPEFVHIRLKDDVEWDRQQRRDTRDPRLRAPVLRRDGDNCRWCGVAVQWRGRRSSRTGTLDHLFPGQPGTVMTMVVACQGCNGSRQDNPQWDDDHDILAEPAAPRYGTTTAAYLSEHGYPTEPNAGSDTAPPGARSSTPTDPARPDQAQRPVPAVGAAPQAQRPEPEPEVVQKVPPKSADKSTGCSDGTHSVGSGRDGSGQTGSGRDGSRGASRRRRRGGRGRGRRGGAQ